MVDEVVGGWSASEEISMVEVAEVGVVVEGTDDDAAVAVLLSGIM